MKIHYSQEEIEYLNSMQKSFDNSTCDMCGTKLIDAQNKYGGMIQIAKDFSYQKVLCGDCYRINRKG